MKKNIIEYKYATGNYLKYKWLVIRQEIGHLCGYVRLWKGHPLEITVETEGYDGIDIDCHGGLTFTHKITNRDKEFKKVGFSNGYWIGWDYAHIGDFIKFNPGLGEKNWTVKEVIKECYDVIEQLTNKYL